MATWFWVALGGALGSMARFWLAAARANPGTAAIRCAAVGRWLHPGLHRAVSAGSVGRHAAGARLNCFATIKLIRSAPHASMSGVRCGITQDGDAHRGETTSHGVQTSPDAAHRQEQARR